MKKNKALLFITTLLAAGVCLGMMEIPQQKADCQGLSDKILFLTDTYAKLPANNLYNAELDALDIGLDAFTHFRTKRPDCAPFFFEGSQVLMQRLYKLSI